MLHINNVGCVCKTTGWPIVEVEKGGVKEEGKSKTNGMMRPIAIAAIALAAFLYYALVLGQYSDKMQ